MFNIENVVRGAKRHILRDSNSNKSNISTVRDLLDKTDAWAAAIGYSMKRSHGMCHNICRLESIFTKFKMNIGINRGGGGTESLKVHSTVVTFFQTFNAKRFILVLYIIEFNHVNVKICSTFFSLPVDLSKRLKILQSQLLIQLMHIVSTPYD